MKVTLPRASKTSFAKALVPALFTAACFLVSPTASHADTPGPSASASVNPTSLTSGWTGGDQYCENTSGNPFTQGIGGQSISAQVGGGWVSSSCDARTTAVTKFTFSGTGAGTSTPPPVSMELHPIGSAYAHAAVQHASFNIWLFPDVSFGGSDDDGDFHMFDFSMQSCIGSSGDLNPGETTYLYKIDLEVHAKNN